MVITCSHVEYFLSQPCSMGFATGGKTFFLWGGCMMASGFYYLIKNLYRRLNAF
jgi:hypothetical protein